MVVRRPPESSACDEEIAVLHPAWANYYIAEGEHVSQSTKWWNSEWDMRQRDPLQEANSEL